MENIFVQCKEQLFHGLEITLILCLLLPCKQTQQRETIKSMIERSDHLAKYPLFSNQGCKTNKRIAEAYSELCQTSKVKRHLESLVMLTIEGVYFLVTISRSGDGADPGCIL